MFKLSPDLNADVQRIQKIKEAKNDTSSTLLSQTTSDTTISLDLGSTQQTLFHTEPQKVDDSIDGIVKFILSFPNPQVGLEQTVNKFGIRLN